MCGIVAQLRRPGAPVLDRDALIRVRDAMAARGPDGAGAWWCESSLAGLGHRRLAIIDPQARADQPMHLVEPDADRDLHLVFNGEIYNHQTLRRELEADGEHFATTSDSEVLLRLLARDGIAALPRLRGMYAFCLWDARRRELLCARDPLGIKPLYLAETAATLWVASQVRALLSAGDVDLAPDPAGHVGFHLFGAVPDPHTMFRGIRALPAGGWLVADAAGRIREGRHFDLRRMLADTAPANGPAPFAAALRDSVAAHLVADVPVGLFLSAGRDAATLGALAMETGIARLDTFNLAFDAPIVPDEADEAAALAAHLGTRHHAHRLTREEFLAARDAFLDSMDQPSTDGANTWWVSRFTAEAGIKVALSGAGADELLGGYPSFIQALALLRLGTSVPAARPLGRALRRLAAPWIGRLASPKTAGMLEYATRLGDAWWLRRGLFMPWELDRIMDPGLVEAGLAALAPGERLAALIEGIASPHGGVHVMETAWYLRHQLLRDADWAGMAHGVEIRVPFVDARLTETLAPWLIGASPPHKDLLNGCPARRLPEAVLNRPKTGFGFPYGPWLAAEDAAWRDRGDRGWARWLYRDYLRRADAAVA